MLDFIKRQLGYFDSYGLRFSTDHLRRVNHKELLDKPIQIVAQYVDKVTFDLVQSGKDSQLMSQARRVKSEGFPEFPLTTTALGNMAFISMHSESLEMKRLNFELLMKYKRMINE